MLKEHFKSLLFKFSAVVVIFSFLSVPLGTVKDILFPEVFAAGSCGPNLQYTLSSDGTFTISGEGEMYDYYSYPALRSAPWISDKIKKVVIENSVTSIGNYAFHYCKRLTDVVIGSSVTSIGLAAFAECSSLKSVNIPGSVENIGRAAFENCKSLLNISISDCVTTVGEYAFNFCTSLTSAYIGDAVQKIKYNTFANCYSLKEVYIGKSVSAIESEAFVYCNGLISVNIPKSVKSIGNKAFYYCLDLASVTIHDSVTSIGESAFAGCSSVTGISLPENLSSVGAYAFNSCKKLRTVSIPVAVANIGTASFSHCDSLTDIYYGGTRSQWNKITMGKYCEVFDSVNIHYHGEHSNIDVYPEKKATCVEVGYTEGKYCNECRRYASGRKEIPIDYSSHKWDAGEMITVATCKVNGVKSYTCQIDPSHKKTENIGTDASKHINIRTVEKVNATCSSVGYTAGVYCNDCKKYISGHREIAKDSSAHKWDSGRTITTATCKESGQVSYTCLNDWQHTYTENIGLNSSNHRNTKNVADVKATCTTKGYTAGVYCNDCQKYISGHKEISALGHSYKNTVTAPKCTSEGYTTHTCTRCNDTYTDSKVKALGHSYKNTVTAPTCTSEGYTTHTCSKCQNTYTDTKVNATGHKWGEWKEVSAPTFTANGKEERSCIFCKKTESRTTDKLSYRVGDVDKNGSITAADARLALRSSVGLENLSAAQKKAADADGNGTITAADARLILRASVGLEKLDAHS